MEEITVLSLFDGMSCGQLALQKAGIKVKQYYAAEIDKYAIQVTQNNFPDTIQLGDVTKVFAKDLPKIDLIIGGSPCQGFSFAGKQLNFKDERSKLFFEFVRLINECRPKYFLLENVKMKKEYELVISKYMGVAPIEINSALVSAQNRVRLYWTNINQKSYGLFGDMITDIPQPKDKGILLKDVLETDVSEKYFLSDKMLNYLNSRKANFNNGKVNYKTGEDVASCINASSGSIDISDNIIIDTNRKSGCFTAGGNIGGLHSQMDLIKCVAMRDRNSENPPRNDDKTNCLTSVQKDNLVMQLNTSTESGGKQPYQQNRVYDTEGISPALMAQMSCGSHAIMVKSNCITEDGYLSTGKRKRDENGKAVLTSMNERRIRRLTPTECERLQTVPDGYTGSVSDTQRYRMLGNGWTVDVISHIFSYMKF